MTRLLPLLLVLPIGCSGKGAAPAKPIERELSFRSSNGMELKGTFLAPPGQNLPAVLLLPGSGPTDRDGNQPPGLVTDLLKQIATSLQKEGIASFRFDKRAAHVYSKAWPSTSLEKMSEFFSWEHHIEDAKAALAMLQKQPEIDPKRTGVAGHSEGSGFAIQIGMDLNGKEGSPKVLVLLGAPGRPMGPIIREQISASLGRANASSDVIKTYMDYTEKAIKEGAEKGTFPPNPPQGLAPIFNLSAAKLVRSYLTIDPARNLKDFKGPVLVLQGQNDIQVSAERDTPVLEKALKARGGKYEVAVIPGASHNLKFVSDPNKDPGFAGEMDKQAMDKIAAWLKANL